MTRAEKFIFAAYGLIILWALFVTTVNAFEVLRFGVCK